MAPTISPSTERGAFVTILLPGHPRGKGRPRFARAGALVRTFTDKKTLSYEKSLSEAGVIAMGPLEPRLDAVSVRIEACFSIPDSWSKKKRQTALMGHLMPTGKPDFDNISKIVGDALNGIVWKDDSQIINASFRKYYGPYPGLIVSVWDWE
jgi:Holliday junction resolvase RusA-like endonuclease